MAAPRRPEVYAPLNTLKPVADNVWIVDGPAIRFGLAGLKLPFPTRMTVIRLADGDLFAHSPTELTDGLKTEIAAIGQPRHLIGPNRIHYVWLPAWRDAFPNADVWLAPHIREQSKGAIDFPARELTQGPYPWAAEIETLPIEGGFMTEFVFFHRTSRTLILTDLIENFEPLRLGWLTRFIGRLGGVIDPHGSTPRDMRMTFAKHKPQIRAAVQRMIGWNPERVILAHGRWYETGGAAELRRAFRWLL